MKKLDVSWLIVHHNNLSNLEPLVSSLKNQGLDEAYGILIDNSESKEVETYIQLHFPKLNKIFIKNLGYGNAVNLGIDELLKRSILKDQVLVCTHDLALEENCVVRMVDQIRSNDQIGAVGPVLLGGSFEPDVIWSSGGHLSKRLGLPTHLNCGKEAKSINMPSQGIYCDWLDGAMCLYRSDIFSQIRFDEDYFLYFEETDFHAQILKLGKTIVCASTAYAAQKTNGIPGYWLGRNAYRFFQKIRPGLAFISFAVIVLMHLVRAARKRQFFVQLKQVAKGFSSQGRRVQTSVVNKGSVHAP